MVKYLLEHDFPVDGRLCEKSSYPGYTPLLIALRNENEGLFKLALKHMSHPRFLIEDYLVFAACLQVLLEYIQEHTKHGTFQVAHDGVMDTAAVDQASPVEISHKLDLEVLRSTSIVDMQLRTTDLLWLDKESSSDSQGSDLEDIEGLTALHLAVGFKDEKSTKLLLQYGANVDALDSSCKTPLHYAAKITSSDLTSLLIQHGAWVDARDDYLRTPAFVATATENVEVLHTLCEYGANLSLRDLGGQNIMSYACLSSAETLAAILSKGHRSTLNQCGSFELLEVALINSNPGVKSLALNSTLAFDHIGGLSHISLDDIIKEEKPSTLRKLIRRTSPSSVPFPTLEQAKRADTASALHVAVAANKPEMLEILLQYGADIEYHEEYEGTPLVTACTAGRFSLVKLLVRRGATISYQKDGTVWDGVGAAKRFPKLAAWLLCGRFTGQKTLNDTAIPSTRDQACGLWSGIDEVEVPLEGELKRRTGESMLEHCVRLNEFRMSRGGTVWRGLP
ncbi:hypothetical protein SLS58_005733 [Diplodia intermedia]|uniref:Ankyrin n=1 Tax=Diplodia intermedia TaxID=856260 RepID=A0ABR3TQ60_9PEZI